MQGPYEKKHYAIGAFHLSPSNNASKANLKDMGELGPLLLTWFNCNPSMDK